MKNRALAKIFNEIATIQEFREYDVFRVRAYRRAALSLEAYPKAVETLSRKELLQIPGIGGDLAAKIEEFLLTGKIAVHEKLKEEVPLGLLELLVVPGLGPKTARMLYDILGIGNLDDLERAATEHRLTGLPKIQKKTEENILKGIAMVKRGRERRPLAHLRPLALELVERLRSTGMIDRIEVAGSIRRWKDTVRDMDIVATAREPAALMEAFVSLPHAGEVVLSGPTKSTILVRDGIQVDLRVVEREAFGAALAYLTGSKMHNVRLREMALRQGLKLNEYGIFNDQDSRIAGAEEEDVYRILGLPYIPPELREDRGEVEAAMTGQLPRLVTVADLRGDLHVHSHWSDGAHSLEQLAAAARERGLSYIAVTDHSQGLGIARGLTVERLMEQRDEIRAFNRNSNGFTILHGTEMDILPDGGLDFPDEVLRELDLVVASIHSAFRQSREQMTARIISALRNPWVSIIGHPTGRLLGERDPYDVDMEEVLQVARETGTAMEINAYPVRLDLTDTAARRARELGVPVAINTDTHVIRNLDALPYGVSVARRGWLEAGDVLNTLPLNELRSRLKAKRGR